MIKTFSIKVGKEAKQCKLEWNDSGDLVDGAGKKSNAI